MGIKFANNISTSLAVPISPVATSIVISSFAGLPVLGIGDYFYATLTNNLDSIEIIKVTEVVADTLTVIRGQDNTTALNWLAGTVFELRVNAAALGQVKDDYFFQNPVVITGDSEILEDHNGLSAGPISINPGVVITVPSGSTWTVV